MIDIPKEHRPASMERTEAENQLAAQGWHKVILPRTSRNNPDFIDMLEWCENNIGQGRIEIEAGKINERDHWYTYSWYGYWNFWFRNEADATMFMMKWV